MSTANRLTKLALSLMLLEACATSSPQTRSPTDQSLTQQTEQVETQTQRRTEETPARSGSTPPSVNLRPSARSPRRPAEIISGTGQFVDPARVQYANPPITRDDGKVSLNLLDAPVETAARTILGEFLGYNYVIQDGVSGTITLQTNAPVPKASLLPILEDVLAAQGLALVESNGLFKILPSAEANRAGQSVVLPGGQSLQPGGFRTIIRPLNYVPAEELRSILDQMGPEGNVLRADSVRNIIVLAGTAQQLENMLDIIDIFDVDWLEGMSFGIIPVSSAPPTEIVRELEAVIFGGTNAVPFSNLLRLVPNDRMGSIIVISPQAQYLDTARDWIERLDRQTTTSTERLYLYNVQNAVAEDLTVILQNVISGSNGFASAASNGRGVAPGLQTTQAERQGTNTGAGLTRGPDNLQGLQGVRIFPYEGRNAIAIVATQDQYTRIERMLVTLDVAANQVLLEATILEVTLRDELDRGVRWFFSENNSEFAFSDLASGAVASTFPGFSYVFDDQNINLAINALSTVTDVDFLSSPSIMVLDNATATLQVGDEVPIATQSAVGVLNPDAPIVNTVTLRDTGVILTITPRVNESGLVLLDIEQEVSDVVPTVTSGIDSPTIQQRRIQTMVAVQDGQSLALGGLVEDSVTQTRNGVPFISRVPLLGELFKSQTDTTERTELLIIIKPRVIKSAQDATDATRELRERLRGIAPFEQRLGRDTGEREPATLQNRRSRRGLVDTF